MSVSFLFVCCDNSITIFYCKENITVSQNLKDIFEDKHKKETKIIYYKSWNGIQLSLFVAQKDKMSEEMLSIL